MAETGLVRPKHSLLQRVSHGASTLVTRVAGEKDSETRATRVSHAARGLGLLNSAHQMGLIGQRGSLFGMALGLIHQKMTDHAARLGAEQRQFQTNAKISRGDMTGITHAELKQIANNPAKYGGPHQDHIAAAAQGEIARRFAEMHPEKHAQQQARVLRAQSYLQRQSPTHNADGTVSSAHQSMEKTNDAMHANRIARQDAEHAREMGRIKEKHELRHSLNAQMPLKPARAAAPGAAPTAPARPKAQAQPLGALHQGFVTMRTKSGKTFRQRRMIRGPGSA